MLAVCQYLGEEGKILIGTSASEQVTIDANPLSLHASQGINEKALDRTSIDERDELLGFLDSDGSEESETEAK